MFKAKMEVNDTLIDEDTLKKKIFQAQVHRVKGFRLIVGPKWRIACLSLMAVAFILLLVAVMSTHWREDQESRYDVFITHGLWRICREIRFGSTRDFKCLSEYANDGPDWFQTVRAFMLMACVACFAGFAYSVYVIVKIPPIEKSNYPRGTVSLALPGFLYLLGAVCTLIGASTYSVATAMDQALYFPESLPPTWGNSWAQVLAKRNTIPSDLPEVTNMKMSYGYTFALAWLSLFTTTASFIANFVASSGK